MNSKHGIALSLALAAIFSSAANATERTSSVQPNAVSCTLIRTAAQLQAMRNNSSAAYCLANDIDLASIPNFIPVGDNVSPFTGSFFGNNHVIRNLTIHTATINIVGLFGLFEGGTIRDVSLVNVRISAGSGATVGGLIGEAFTMDNDLAISNVSVTGKINCAVDADDCGGIAGEIFGYNLIKSWSSADISGGEAAGGLVGENDGTISDSFATGDVSSTFGTCEIGGLAGNNNGPIRRSFATGSVTGGNTAFAGGLAGVSGALISQSFASGAVAVGPSSDIGGLIAFAESNSVTEQSFSVGHVAASSGGLIGVLENGGIVTNSYWDTSTSGTTVSAAGTGLTTAQLQSMLPAGFDAGSWAINQTLSYPFVNSADLPFVSPLATSVLKSRVYTFLPISQLDLSQYRFKPAHADEAALAAVYTMIARAIGSTLDVPQLKDVKLDRFFWHDAQQRAGFAGPVTMHATLGALHPVGANLTPVVNQLAAQRLVILRGTFTTAKGATATHWMLATLDTRTANGKVTAIVANDPWTGWQVEIDPASRKVVSPVNFPLANFTVNAFQPVTIH